MTIARGTLFAGRYDVGAAEGEGAMGTVHFAHDRATGEPVALKVLHDDAAGTRFEREARVLAVLRHPAIVRYVDHGVTAEGERYLVTAWLAGEDLEKRLARSPLSLGATIALGRRIAEALAAAHDAGVVHRDVKPSNVFLVGRDVDGTTLIDFGVARARDPYRTATGAVVGTLAYMAPEQARGEREVDGRADLFALGCVLYECVTGVRPFAATTPLEVRLKIVGEEPPRVAALRRDVPPIVDAFVHRLLAKSPGDRLPDAISAAAMLAGLRTLDAPPPAPSVVLRVDRADAVAATQPESLRPKR